MNRANKISKKGFTPLESPAINGGDEIYKIFLPYRKGGVKAPSFLTGFTLIELILVIVILSFGLVTMLLVLRNASANNAYAHFVTVAGELANSRLEEAAAARRTLGFNGAGLSIGTTQESIPDFPAYSYEINIEYVNIGDLNTGVGGPTNYKRVEAKVLHASLNTDLALVTVVSNY